MQATKIFKTEIIERHSYDKQPQAATVLNKSCISIGDDGAIKRTPFESGILSGLDLHRSHVLHRGQVVDASQSYAEKTEEGLHELSKFPYSTIVGHRIETEAKPVAGLRHSAFVDTNKLDQCFTSGRVTISSNISSFDETVNSYPSRVVPAEATSARSFMQFQQAEPAFPRTQAPRPPTPSQRPASRERMCDAEVRHQTVVDGPFHAPAPFPTGRSSYVAERVSDAEVWNQTVQPAAPFTPSFSPPTSGAYLARPAELRAHTPRAGAPSPRPARVVPLTVTVSAAPYTRSVGALISPRPAAARCYTYSPVARPAYKEHQYC